LSIAELDFAKPATLAEALEALAQPGAMAIGGGTSLTILLKNRLIEPEHLVFIGDLPELSGIRREESGEIHLGATTTMRELARSELLAEAAPVIPEAAAKIGNPRVRAVATVGGALVHGDPRQDLPTVLLALRGRLLVSGATASREVALAEFYLGFMDVALEESELVTAAVIPSREGWRDAYSRFTPGSDDDYPTVGVAVGLRRGAGGVIEDLEIALGGVDAAAILTTDAARSLVGTRGAQADLEHAADLAAAQCNPGDDQRGSASYKRAMVKVWTVRTLAACLT
jgi:aerobic carbon-monoxide dehydrogenase medium subunit